MSKKAKPAAEPTSWIVTMRCVINREVICDDCTEAQAQCDPFEYAVSESDMGVLDWDVQRVEPNM